MQAVVWVPWGRGVWWIGRWKREVRSYEEREGGGWGCRKGREERGGQSGASDEGKGDKISPLPTYPSPIYCLLDCWAAAARTYLLCAPELNHMCVT